MSHGRSLGSTFFSKSTNQRWGKKNHVKTKNCSSERSIHKNSYVATGCRNLFSKKRSARPGCLRFLYEACCCTAPGPERKAAAYTWTHERERLLGFGGRQHDGAAPV